MTRGVFLAGAMVVGCNAIFGIDELETSVQPAQGGAATAASTVTSTASSTAQSGGAGDCETCAGSTSGCAAERAACSVDPSCSALSKCMNDCTDSSCRAVCLQTYAEGIPALYAQYDCERCTGSCRQLCQAECDGCGGADCGECANSGCVQMACSELWNECITNSDCVAVAMCLSGCMDDPTCEDQCANMHRQGAEILAELALCAKCSWDTCYDICGGAMECAP